VVIEVERMEENGVGEGGVDTPGAGWALGECDRGRQDGEIAKIAEDKQRVENDYEHDHEYE
jgi:hypothetical protein